MNAPTNSQPANSQWSEKRCGPETRHWLPRNPDSAIDHIPGEDGMPVLGNKLEQLRDYPAFTRRMVANYGRVSRTNRSRGRRVALPGTGTTKLHMYAPETTYSSDQVSGPVRNVPHITEHYR